MLKPLLFALLLPAMRPAFTQTVPAAQPAAAVPYQYCTLVSAGGFSYNARVFLEYG